MAQYEKRGLLHFYERARAAKAKSERKRTQVGLIGPHHPAPSDGIVCVSARSCPGWWEIIASWPLLHHKGQCRQPNQPRATLAACHCPLCTKHTCVLLLECDQKRKSWYFQCRWQLETLHWWLRKRTQSLSILTKRFPSEKCWFPCGKKTNESNSSIPRVLSQNIVLRDWTNKHWRFPLQAVAQRLLSICLLWVKRN